MRQRGGLLQPDQRQLHLGNLQRGLIVGEAKEVDLAWLEAISPEQGWQKDSATDVKAGAACERIWVGAVSVHVVLVHSRSQVNHAEFRARVDRDTGEQGRDIVDRQRMMNVGRAVFDSDGYVRVKDTRRTVDSGASRPCPLLVAPLLSQPFLGYPDVVMLSTHVRVVPGARLGDLPASCVDAPSH